MKAWPVYPTERKKTKTVDTHLYANVYTNVGEMISKESCETEV